MGDDKKKDKPKAYDSIDLEKISGQLKYVHKMKDTLAYHLDGAMDAAIKEHAYDKDKKVYDFEVFGDVKVQDKALDQMWSKLDDTMKDAGIDLSKMDDLYKDHFRQTYFGINRATMKQELRTFGGDYSRNQLKKTIENSTEQIHQQLNKYAVSDIKRQHAKDVLKYINTNTSYDVSNINQDKMDEQSLGQLLTSAIQKTGNIDAYKSHFGKKSYDFNAKNDYK